MKIKKRILVILSLAITIAFPCSSFAEKPDAQKAGPDLTKLKHPVKACLWKVEGKGLKKPSWLFGTIHLGDKRVVTLHPNAEKAFTGADVLYTEIDMSQENQMKIVPRLMRKDGKKLSESIGPKLTAQLNTELKAVNPVFDITPFEALKTWGIAIRVPTLELQMRGKQPLDAQLYSRATDAKKTTRALETIAQHLSFFESMKEAEQITLLSDMLTGLKEDRANGVNSLQKLLNIYLTGDAGDIAKFTKDEIARNDRDKALTDRMMKALLDDRNKCMADEAIKNLTAEPGKSHFFAVGAGHYAGEGNVQSFLKKAGYRITPAFE
jgi:uncharacterized protein YbaP (TraB family)